MQYPSSKKEQVIDKFHGKKVTDDYRWLEDSKNTEVKDWVEKQNKFTDSFFNNEIKIDAIEKELNPLFKVDSVGIPVPRKKYYFSCDRKNNENQRTISVQKSLQNKKETIVDANKIDPSGKTSISFWNPSPKGSYLIYGLSHGGTEMSTLFVIDVSTKEKIAEIPHTRYSSTAWLEDESGFYYTKHPDPKTVNEEDRMYNEKVYLHYLKDNGKEDELIFGKDIPKKSMLGISLSEDNNMLVIKRSDGWYENEAHFYETTKKKIVCVLKEKDTHFYTYFYKKTAYVLTDYKSPNFKVISCDIQKLDSDLSKWKETIKEKDYLLDSIKIMSDRIICRYYQNATSRLEVYNTSGKFINEIELPTLGSVYALSGMRHGNELFFSFDSFVYPKQMFMYKIKEESVEKIYSSHIKIKSDEFITKQEWYNSKDGTKIPCFIIHHKDVKKGNNNPVCLCGYGGFGSKSEPHFLVNYIPFLNRNGIMAIPCIRGGGEFGEKWHRDGTKDKKQNSFDDFISAAEYIISQKYTKNLIVIRGMSNGGLLVGACMTQRPEIFQGVICGVPLLDMLRFHKNLIAHRWVHEYGDPDEKEGFENIIKWSPYHNIDKKKIYPSVMFITAENDLRVHPFHARKMTALLQSFNKNLTLLRTNKDSGHGPGKSVSQTIRDTSEILGFIFWSLGMRI